MNRIKRGLCRTITRKGQATNDQKGQRKNDGAPDPAPVTLVERTGEYRHGAHNSR